MDDVGSRLREVLPFWARVERRFGRQPLLLALGGTSLVLIVAALIAVSVSGGGGGGSQRVSSEARPTTTNVPQTTALGTPVEVTTSTNPPRPGQTPPPPTAAPPPPTTRPRTEVVPPPSIVYNPPPRSPTTVTTLPPTCNAGDLDLTTTVDSESVAPNAQVGISTVAKNVSSRACNVSNSCRFRRLTVEDSSGTLVYDSKLARQAGDCPVINEVPRTLLPGESFKDLFTWDQKTCVTGSCPGAAVGTGTYVARGHWEQGTAKPATIRIASATPSG